MDQVHVKSKSNSKGNNTTKSSCEKASRRLRTILVKASRLGVSTAEVAKLPAAKKLIPQKNHSWRLTVFLFLMFAGGVIVALVCTARTGCTRLEDISLGDIKVEAGSSRRTKGERGGRRREGYKGDDRRNGAWCGKGGMEEGGGRDGR
ncbi:hypothetical protein V1478_017021 [Vespula squamosa]|uniref:Transmembrane protein n=1 Tax=Vespula squamosa TaxID=30214 RepID=A0ABD1ZY72_VESSQ